MTTQVVNIKKQELQKRGYTDFAHWARHPDHLYIGRDQTRHVPGTIGSKWANPFPAWRYTLEECVARYEQHIRETPELWESLHELVGKELGCWCKPQLCHGDILLSLMKERGLTG